MKETRERGDGRRLQLAPSVVWACYGRQLEEGQGLLNSALDFKGWLPLIDRMFVRGLQASYNQYAPQYGIRIPHGDLLLFGACSGQIMFAWLLSPETIPHGYSKWYVERDDL